MRILMIAVGKMDKGGIESYLMELYRYLVDKGIYVDFVVHRPDVGCYEEEIISNGSKVFKLPRLSRHPLKYFKQLRNVMKQGKYDIVHRHATASVMWIDLAIAKWAGIKTRIAHSHSSNWNHVFIHKVFRPLLNYYATDRFACSEIAGQWMFGKISFYIMNNGIDVAKYQYDECVRQRIREELNVQNAVMVLHVGRFVPVKNHDFILELGKSISKNDYIFLLAGDGPLKDEVVLQIKESGLEDKIKILGQRDDVKDLVMAADYMILPSHFEGLPVSLIEAQCSGLKCIVSEHVSKEANLGLVEHLPLDADMWKNYILNDNNINAEREDAYLSIIEHGYSIEDTTKKMLEYYNMCLGREL